MLPQESARDALVPHGDASHTFKKDYTLFKTSFIKAMPLHAIIRKSMSFTARQSIKDEASLINKKMSMSTMREKRELFELELRT